MSIPDGNYINMSRGERDTQIYRVMDVERVLNLFRSRSITLRRPACWNDPFENILLHCKTHLRDGTAVGFDGVMKCFYGQCWTLREESDAMWRIYSPHDMAAKIKTTITKLFTAIYDPEDINADRRYWIGKVRYEDQAEMVKTLQSLLSNFDDTIMFVTDHTFFSQALTLLFKREAFEDEEEIRLIFRADDPQGLDERTFAIDPNNLIDEVIFDPRMEPDLFADYRMQLQDLGYKGRIERSTLYDVPRIDSGY